jgi:hypothetical protein
MAETAQDDRFSTSQAGHQATATGQEICTALHGSGAAVWGPSGVGTKLDNPHNHQYPLGLPSY